jgi:hypothetical protein
VKIEIDLAALVHEEWQNLPRHVRWLWRMIPGGRKRIEAYAVAKLREGGW